MGPGLRAVSTQALVREGHKVWYSSVTMAFYVLKRPLRET